MWSIQIERWGQRGSQALLLGVSLGALSACDSLLEAELPHLLTDAAIEGSGTAETQVMSAIALFECGYTALGLTALGHEDVLETVAGAGQQHQYQMAAGTGNCDTSSASTSWVDGVMGARSLLTTDPAKLVATATGAGNGVYDRINRDWELGAEGERLSAIASIYVAASLTQFGEFVCEAALDGSDLLSPTDVLNLADDWITDRALLHIDNFGDFEMPNDIAASAHDMAIGLRSRIRWANRDFAGAAADAATVLAADPDFTAWVTREAGETRRNKIYHSATAVGYSAGAGINVWWGGSNRSPNPATGQLWPNPIPFTGYLFLAITPDGRTLNPGNTPVSWAEERRDSDGNPVPRNNGAVPDTRVQHIYKSIQGPGLREVPGRYSSEDEDVPYITWQELRLIIADNELAQGNLQAAIDQVNIIRSDHGLPTISGAYLASLQGDAAAVRAMLLEERRREFYAEGGRYWSTKIQNTDLLWFPRAEGQTSTGYLYQGAVRQHFPSDEFESNPNLVARGGLDIRGTACASLPGSQAPVIL